MRGAAQFYSDLLIEDAKHQHLIVAPANSPENHFLMPDGRDVAVSAGTTVHAQMIRYLFNACIESSKILGVDEDFRKELEAKVARLSPTPIGSDGRVIEWPEEHPEPELHHRHISHLWALYPGDEITPEGTPALVQAAKKTLVARGDDGLGWSYAYRALLWARAGDGNHAWLIVKRALSPVVTHEIRYDNGGGVYPNLFDACPAISDRQQFWRDSGHRRDAVAKPGRNHPFIAGDPRCVAGWKDGRFARARWFSGGHDVARREAGFRDHPIGPWCALHGQLRRQDG